MSSASTITITGLTGGVRVRLNHCPSCRRSIRLDHAGVVADGATYVDMEHVERAQRVHELTCTG